MLKNISIKSKNILIVSIILVFISFLFTGYSIMQINEISEKNIKEFENKEYENKKNELKNYVNVMTTKIDGLKNKTKEEIYNIINEDVNNIRFDKDGYFWVHTLDLKMFNHPINKSLNNTDISKIKDANNKFLFEDMNKIVKKDSEGFIEYLWEKTDSKTKEPKLSFVKQIKNTDLIIGTGIYINDIKETILLMEQKTKEEISKIIINSIIIALILIFISSLLMYITFNLFITKEINNFTKEFKNFLDFITFKRNQFDIKNINENSKNEFIILNKIINNTAKEFDTNLKNDIKLMGEIVLITNKLSQGHFDCKIIGNTKNPMIFTLSKAINHLINTLKENMNNINNCLSSFDKNDFTKRIKENEDIKDTLLEVVQNVNKLGITLSNNARQNLENGNFINSKSNNMLSAMNTLSNKANQQAASLEETSASVEEITAITKNNTLKTNEMSNLSIELQQKANVGKNLANQTNISMEEINEKVKAINEAITIIDQISFQTNILSLNAAVEAATAGEAGKGFAVVAQEVRNLASRSAEAAKQIKELVSEATNKANDGKNIAGEMILGFEELDKNLNKTINLIKDISLSSNEQLIGIEQINDAVTLLDKITQENAFEAGNVLEISRELEKIAKNLELDAKNKRF